MDYELIALDLDDTLLTADKTVPAANRQAVTRAAQAGVHVVFASGRAFEGIAPIADALGIKDYVISVGGGFVYDSEGRVVHDASIDSETARAVMEWAEKRGIHFQAYKSSGMYYLHRNSHTDSYEKTYGFRGHEDPDLLSKDIRPGKILLIDSQPVIDECRVQIPQLFQDLRVLPSEPGFLEIVSSTASKGASLAFLADHLQIPAQRILAMGDGLLDCSMIEFAGLGVAMGNAPPAVRESADYVAPANTEGGVARIIEQFVL